MTETELEIAKIGLPLFGVFLGWLLGIGSNFIMIWFKSRELRKALISELLSLHASLENLHLLYARDLQVFMVGEVERGVPVKLSHAVYENHYKDICYKLNQEQRRSYELIHEHINSLNNRIDDQQKAIDHYIDNPSKEAAEKWAGIVEAQYANVRITHFHVTRHLNNPSGPDLSVASDSHNEYLNYLREINKDIQTILENAKKLTREQLFKELGSR